MEERIASMIRPGDVVTAGGRSATVVAGPTRNKRAPGKVNFLARCPDGRGVSFTVADTDRLEVVA
jgi:hypothetical protein